MSGKDVRAYIRDKFGVSFWDTLYKSLWYNDILLTTSSAYQRWRIARLRKQQQRIVERLQEKKRYKVVFFLQNDSIWKYDALYRLMEASELFEPVVVISPYNVHIIYDKSECLRVMQRTEAYAAQQGYNYISAYDYEHHKWRNIKKMLRPDIVFFTKPYKDTRPAYHIYNFTDTLTLYIAYGIACIDIYRQNYNLSFHNMLWRFLVETSFHKELSEQYALCKGDNVAVVGAVSMEKIMRRDYVPQNVWKPQPSPKKRIIWAPHHTVDYLFNFSNFLVYADDMLRLAEKYKDSVQFAFKPHPVLKFKLINIWGAERTEQYYKQWDELSNSQLVEGDYMDLFITSDALIHDCGSFTGEYLYTQKPVLFMVRDPQVEKHWNPFGRKCYDQHYKAHDLTAIEHFIEDVVIKGNDSMSASRETFYRQYLYPQDGVMPSQKIFTLLQTALGK